MGHGTFWSILDPVSLKPCKTASKRIFPLFPFSNIRCHGNYSLYYSTTKYKFWYFVLRIQRWIHLVLLHDHTSMIQSEAGEVAPPAPTIPCPLGHNGQPTNSSMNYWMVWATWFSRNFFQRKLPTKLDHSQRVRRMKKLELLYIVKLA